MNYAYQKSQNACSPVPGVINLVESVNQSVLLPYTSSGSPPQCHVYGR